MQNIAGFVKGRCLQMCPEAEINFRQKENLIHPLEAIDSKNKRKLRADKSKVVKSYSRSAAGLDLTNPNNLRPFEVLMETVNYLLREVIKSEKLPWYQVYEFIADRLLAVRQDMVVQNLSVPHSIELLQPIVKFYAFAPYLLCGESVSHFDPVINGKQLQECLKKLLSLYDLQYLRHPDEHMTSRGFYEGVYILWNFGEAEALMRGISVPLRYRDEYLRTALKISLCWRKKNWIRTCRMIEKDLPLFYSIISSYKLAEIRQQAFLISSIAYNSAISKYPASDLRKQLLYERTDFTYDCKYYCLPFDEDNDVVNFRKNKMEKKPPVPLRKETFLNEKLPKKCIFTQIITDEIPETKADLATSQRHTHKTNCD